MRVGEQELVAVLFSLDVSAERREGLFASLSLRERERFESFAHEEHRLRWGTGRGTLREILGSALGIAPAAVAFEYGEHGKPRVAGSSLRFNLSHSGPHALLALAHAEVGADIELPRPRRIDQIARRFFTPGEIERLFRHEERADPFFRLWTCKEAFLKCTGEGLGRSTRSYEVALGEGGARLLWAERVDASLYSIYTIETGSEARAAIVAQAEGLSLRVVGWP